MASKIRENTAQLARIEKAIEVLQDEADQPFVQETTVASFKVVTELLEVKANWLRTQIAKETPLTAVA